MGLCLLADTLLFQHGRINPRRDPLTERNTLDLEGYESVEEQKHPIRLLRELGVSFSHVILITSTDKLPYSPNL